MSTTAGNTKKPDWLQRKELKFLMRNENIDVLRQVLRGTCRQVVHNQRVSIVRSVYFDDPHLSACQANLKGLANRQKLRFRWYDTMQPEGQMFAEVKWRRNRITGKHRHEMKSASFPLRWNEWLRQAEEVVPEPIAAVMQFYREPIVLVEYKREHFQSSIDGIRLTLDYDLVFYGQIGKSQLSVKFGQRSHGTAVMEGKVPVGMESQLKQFIYPFAARVQRCSKYVLGCRSLGLVSGG